MCYQKQHGANMMGAPGIEILTKKWPRKYPKDLRGQRLVAGVKTPKPRNV